MSKYLKVLPIVGAASEQFFPGLKVALASAVAAASGNMDYEVHVLSGGIPLAELSLLEQKLHEIAAKRNIKLAFFSYQVDGSNYRNLPQHHGSYMTYSRLSPSAILPDHDSVVFLDADVLCLTGLENFLPTQQKDGCLLGGCLDYFDTLGRDCPWITELSDQEKKLPYINCGMIWMNLAEMRKMNFVKQAFERAQQLLSKFHDQTILNFICRGKINVLPANINHVLSIGSSHQICKDVLQLNLHYIGGPKPWLGNPKTSNWLAHSIWHQANHHFFPETPMHQPAIPQDRKKIFYKMLLYKIFNPSRAKHYDHDLQSLKSSSDVLAKTAAHWQKIL